MPVVSVPPTIAREPRAILLFDGACSLCQGVMRFLAKRDPAGRIAFTALASDDGRRLLREHGLPEGLLDTVVLLQNGRVFLRSDAPLRAMRSLRAPWPLAALALVLPRALRDTVYDVIARNRHRWLGGEQACSVARSERGSRSLSSTPSSHPKEPPWPR